MDILITGEPVLIRSDLREGYVYGGTVNGTPHKTGLRPKHVPYNIDHKKYAGRVVTVRDVYHEGWAFHIQEDNGMTWFANGMVAERLNQGSKDVNPDELMALLE